MRYAFWSLTVSCTLSCFSLFTAVGNVSAGDTMDTIDTWAEVGEDIGQTQEVESKKGSEPKWAVGLGLVGGFAPDYEGSDDYEFGGGPDLSASWNDLIFYKGKTLSINAVKTGNFKIGPIVSLDSGRDEDDNDKLEGLGDVDNSIEVGGFVTYRMKPMRFHLEVRQDVDSGHEGALAEFTAGTSLPFETIRSFLFVGTTWASDDYMESFFGVSSEQSTDSGLKQYNADAGFKDVRIGITGGYSLTNRWKIGAKLEYKRLVGDAADSPIVDDENQFLAGANLTYQWGSKVGNE